MTSRLPAIVVLGLLVTFLVGPFVVIVAASLSGRRHARLSSSGLLPPLGG